MMYVKLTVVNVILTLLDRHPLPVQWDTVWFSAALHHQSVPGGLAGVCVVLPEWHAYTVGAHMCWFSQVVCWFGSSSASADGTLLLHALKYVCSPTDLSCTILPLSSPPSSYLCLQLYPLLSFPLLSPSHSLPVSILLLSSTSLSLLPSSSHAMPCPSSLHILLLPCHRDVIWRELSGLLSFSTSSTSSCT